ncbi:hypothetical protein OSB04_015321 [Centaurea solstitialis]|uniref:Uncharacterized protein n=1 Tax=Centaurea solstitialis TaxID=347529 RepID=A0AA38T9Y6_9ASTR|nr:hypothetical protein OSB04_015321 [Centaurea solstitialis]
MADEAGAPVTAIEETAKADSPAAAQQMDLETVEPANGGKREREEELTTESPENGNDAKKAKVDEEEEKKPVEEEMPEKEAAATGPVTVGYKSFETSVQIFDYFFKFLHFWPPNLNVNKYEHAMLLDLLKKGHLDAERKIGSGIHAFQVRYHPQWKSRCFFLVREDESADDFSFRKCVDHILPLPENMAAGGGGGGRGGGAAGVAVVVVGGGAVEGASQGINQVFYLTHLW